MLTVGHLSCGNWRIDNDKIILTDRDNNFQISCTYTYTDKARNYLKNGIEITAGESFKWLTGLKFQKWLELDKNNYYDLPDFTDFPFQSNFNQTLALHEREEHCFDENKNTLLFGEYTNGYYHLWINPDNTYSLNVAINEYDLREKREVLVVFNDFSQSEGIWEREGNVLTLFDTSVKCPFYLIITEEGLKPNQMMFSLHEHLYIFEYKQQFQE
jgi:hypothetical protein